MNTKKNINLGFSERRLKRRWNQTVKEIQAIIDNERRNWFYKVYRKLRSSK